MKSKYKMDISHKKQHFNKVTQANAKQQKYTDGEGLVLTTIGWKIFARERGYIAENSMTNQVGKFIIYNPITNRTIKVLQKVKE